MNFMLFAPEFAVTVLAFLVLGADLVLNRDNKRYLPWIGLIGLVGVLALSLLYLGNKDAELYDGLFLIDGFSLFFKIFFVVLGALVILLSIDFVKQHLSHPGEYYGILLFSILAMMLMAASGELLTAYISLELLSFSLYVLVAFGRENPRSSEAGGKYILLGAFASALWNKSDIRFTGNHSICRDTGSFVVRPVSVEPWCFDWIGIYPSWYWFQSSGSPVPHVGTRCL